jgi:hypothetical protein
LGADLTAGIPIFYGINHFNAARQQVSRWDHAFVKRFLKTRSWFIGELTSSDK